MKPTIFERRLSRHMDELRWLYMELYGNDAMFAELCDNLHRFAEERSAALKKRDLEREADPEWYRSNDLTGMMLYIDNFAGDLNGVRKKLPYIEETGVNLIHLMPFLDTVPERSDGGYAVADFRAVRPDLGTMDDLEKLSAACHKKGINLCMDFVMNHTSQDHEWAKKARQGDGEYMSRYFFFNNWSIPAEYEKTVPQVFPTTAPGNFTWLDDCQHFVMTSFYPYQWDLNYRNPRVFNEMMYNFLFLANKGMDMIRIDAVPYIWKELGTDCRNLPQVHTIVRMMRMIGEIVCPSVTVVTITKDGTTVKTGQLMKLIGLGIKQGDTISVTAEGNSEDAAAAAMEQFFKMRKFTYTIANPTGIDTRRAGLLGKLAKNYPDTMITITKGGDTVKAGQLMKLISLDIKQGDTVSVAVEGGDEDAAAAAVAQFLQGNL